MLYWKHLFETFYNNALSTFYHSRGVLSWFLCLSCLFVVLLIFRAYLFHYLKYCKIIGLRKYQRHKRENIAVLNNSHHIFKSNNALVTAKTNLPYHCLWIHIKNQETVIYIEWQLNAIFVLLDEKETFWRRIWFFLESRHWYMATIFINYVVSILRAAKLRICNLNLFSKKTYTK